MLVAITLLATAFAPGAAWADDDDDDRGWNRGGGQVQRGWDDDDDDGDDDGRGHRGPRGGWRNQAPAPPAAPAPPPPPPAAPAPAPAPQSAPARPGKRNSGSGRPGRDSGGSGSGGGSGSSGGNGSGGGAGSGSDGADGGPGSGPDGSGSDQPGPDDDSQDAPGESGSDGEEGDGDQDPGRDGDGEGDESGEGENQADGTAQPGNDLTERTASAPADAGDRAVSTPTLPVTIPAAAPPVAAPQRQATGRRERGSANGGGGANETAADTPGGGSAAGAAAGPGAGVAGAAGAGVPGVGALAGAAAVAAVPGETSGEGGSGSGSGQGSGDADREASDEPGSPVTRTVTRTVRDIVEVMPESAKVALAALGGLAVLLGTGYALMALRARRLGRQRRELLQEVGLLQGALLPDVPEAIGALRTSVAYRPAEGLGAGGDFYDVLPLSAGRVGFILGDVSGHGHEALQRTAFMRYTLRAYLEAGLEPRIALQVAGRVIDGNLGGDFATVLLAVHDPRAGTLTYASAGHPGPIVIGNGREHEPVTTASSPPIGIGVRTGLRQTTVPLTHGSIACLFTDGLTEARTEDGILGRWRLQKLLKELGPGADGQQLLDRVATVARVTSDDMATVLVAPSAGATAGGFPTEQLELSALEVEGPLAAKFLAACAIPDEEAARALHDAKAVAGQFGGVVLHVVMGNRRTVEVLPRNVESIEAASRRAASAV